MEESLVTQVTRYLKSQRRRKIGYQVLTCMASVVVFCTVYALILPAITISNELTCGMEQHEHDESCYSLAAAEPQPELVCDTSDLPGILLHTHNKYCYDNDGNLICTLTEREAHTHGGSCYQEHLNLICDQVQVMGHTHSAACYARDRGELICTTPEGEGQHVHSDACLQTTEKQVLACGKTEGEAHTHDESCYTTQTREKLVCGESEGEAHTHDESCYTTRTREKLVCGESEGEAHTHDESCYTTRTREKLVCGEKEESAHTHGSSCYTTRTREVLTCTRSQGPDEYDEEGNLIAAGHTHDSSCYRIEEETELTCTQRETAGHTHSASCYETEEERVLSCSRKEGGGHTHSAGCYETVEERTLSCSRKEGGGHTHSESCYETVEERVLSCSKREGGGHTHDASCYKTETETIVLCGQEEGAGHVHSDSCYEWTERLICTEEERPAGHIHDDSCYKKETVLSCHKMEIQEHTHSESCYDEEGTLTCTRREVSRHQHTAACVSVPESTGEQVPTLTCGLPEHIHSETCYVDIVPPAEQEFFCGIPEHTHGEDCYFEDGVTLRCTMPEHVHDDECRQPPELPEEPKQAGAEGVELDHDITYEDDAFLVTFHIRGFAPLLYSGELKTLEDSDVYYSAGPAAGETGSPGESVTAPDPEPAPDPDPAPDPVPALPEAPADGGGSPDGSFGGFAGEEDGGAAPGGDSDFGGFGEDSGYNVPPAEDAVILLNPDDVNFHVEALAESSREYRRMAACAEEYNDSEELPMFQVITFSADIDGEELDLSGCAVEVEITLSDLLMEYLDSYSEAQAMAIPEDGFDGPAEDGGESAAEDSEFLLMALTEEDGEVTERGSVALGGESGQRSLSFPLSRQDNNSVALALLPKVYPLYTVEYYANLDRPALGGAAEKPEKGHKDLPFIDTSKATGKGRLPRNGETAENGGIAEKFLWIDSSGNVIFQRESTPVYQTEEFRFNPKLEGAEDTRLKVESLNALADNEHYTLAGMQVFQPGPGRDPEDEENWVSYDLSQLEELRFTNNSKTTGDNVVLLQQGEYGQTILRLMYDPVSGTHNNDVTLFDYDITDGTQSGTNPIQVEARQKGINSPGNYASGGTKLAFGNGNTNTQLGDETWNGNFLNKANAVGKWPNAVPQSYGKCTFGLVSGMAYSEYGVVPVFNVNAPELFGTKDVKNGVTGKYRLTSEHNLIFDRQGDTYTLMEVSGTRATGLKSFHNPFIDHGQGYGDVWSNGFWPMDELETGGSDLPFGKVGGALQNHGTPFTASDDLEDHNNYFGMQFQVSFTLSEEYVGPLEYFFYGDDDMWVFLDGQLVCDIGGVHASVGEYVDLWDYVRNADGTVRSGRHTLSFFYTERGASGSTCWMQYTLPNATSVPEFDDPDMEDRPLRIEKHVEGSESLIPVDQEYKFFITFENVQGNNIQAVRYRTGDPSPIGAPFEIDGAGTTEFLLRDGEYLEIIGLPVFARYVVTEDTSGLTGCHVSADVISDGKVEGSFLNGPAQGGLGDGQTVVRFTNSFHYSLPETGGTGIFWYTLAGALLPAATGGLWYRRRKSRGEGAVH